jgi:NADH-quinone oxidoreductase subunit N
MTWSSVAPAIAEIYLVAAICVILLVDVFLGDKRRGLTSTLTLLALAVGAALTVCYGHVTHHSVLFDGMYVADELGYVLKLAGFLFVAVALLYSRAYLENRNILRGEYSSMDSPERWTSRKSPHGFSRRRTLASFLGSCSLSSR